MAEKKEAGAFDIRNVIGVLMGLYGVILLLMGLFGDAETDKTGGVDANLWAGIGLAVVGVVFIAWSRMRPVKVPEEVEPVGDDETRPAPRKKPRDG
jgi:high-affinity Fe2+/Pb2+ permease